MKMFTVCGLLLALMISPSVFAAGNAATGKTIYLKRCATCHAEDGNGKDSIAQMMKVTIPQLPSKEVQALSDDELHKVLSEGKGKMKPVKDLSAEDSANVIAFIRSLARK